MDFTVLGLHAGIPEWQTNASTQGYDEALLARCGKVLQQLRSGSKRARIGADGYPEMEIGFGLPPGRIEEELDSDAMGLMFWLGRLEEDPISAHVFFSAEAPETSMERELKLWSSACGPDRHSLEGFEELVYHSVSLRPVLITSLLYPLSEHINRRLMGIVREIPRHLIRSLLTSEALTNKRI